MSDDVALTDLEVIQQFSLAVRGATAPRDAVVAALRADLAFLTGERGRSKPTTPPAPKRPATAPAAKAPEAPATAPAAKAPARNAPVKALARTKAPGKAPVKGSTRAPAKAAVKALAKRAAATKASRRA